MATRSTGQRTGIKGTVSYAIAQVAQVHRKRANDLLGEVGLHAGQEMTLEALWSEGSLSQTELAERLGVRKATVTVSLKSMERDGLIARRRDPEDERVMRVEATDAGMDLQLPVYSVWARLDEETLSGLTTAEQKTLERLLKKVRRNLEEGD